MPILHENIIGSRTAMMTCLYQGYHYDLYRDHSKYISTSHQNFAAHNNWDYIVMGDGVNQIYQLDQRNGVDAKSFCLGMNKWYAMNWLFENRQYDSILFVDFDSVFLKTTKLELTPDTIELSPVTSSPYYDSVWFLAYAMASGMTYEQISTGPTTKFNSGFMKIEPDFFNVESLDRFVDFAVSQYHDRTGWLAMHNVDMSCIQQHWNTTLTPFDEVWLQHQILNKQPDIKLFDTDQYNVNNVELINEDTVHVHFCTNKRDDLMSVCDLEIAEWAM